VAESVAPPAPRESGWSPLRFTAFRRWWFANLTSNAGSRMQTVAAQWVMTTLTINDYSRRSTSCSCREPTASAITTSPCRPNLERDLTRSPSPYELGTSPHLTQCARQVVGSTWTTSLRPQPEQKRGGSVARWRASHGE